MLDLFMVKGEGSSNSEQNKS